MKFALLGLLFVSLLLFGCTSSVEKTTGEQATVLGAPADATAAATVASTQPAASSTPTKLDLSLGESATVTSSDGSSLKITVESVSRTPYHSYQSSVINEKMGEFSSQGKEFYLFKVSVENMASNKIYVSYSNFKLIGTDKSQTELSYYAGDDGLNIADELLAGSKKEGFLLFEAPTGLPQPKLVYDFATVFESQTKLVSWSFDKESVGFKENVDFSAEITDVEKEWTANEYLSYGHIGSISYKLVNSGNIAIIPKTDYSITCGSKEVENKTDANSNSVLKLNLLEGETKEDKLFNYVQLEGRGSCVVKLVVTDQRTGKTVQTEKTIDIS